MRAGKHKAKSRIKNPAILKYTLVKQYHIIDNLYKYFLKLDSITVYYPFSSLKIVMTIIQRRKEMVNSGYYIVIYLNFFLCLLKIYDIYFKKS